MTSNKSLSVQHPHQPEFFHHITWTHQMHVQRTAGKENSSLTAFTSPKFPRRAKCPDKHPFVAPAQTPHRLRRILLPARTPTRMGLGKAGLRQSRIIATSLKTSASSRYILHSGSSAVPSRWAKSIVAIRPSESCRTERRRAEVGDAVLSPTPTPVV
jgi:hypothetical protein